MTSQLRLRSVSSAGATVRSMQISTVALVNGAFALLTVLTLGLVASLGLRIHRVDSEDSLVPAEPTPLALHREELSRAA